MTINIYALGFQPPYNVVRYFLSGDDAAKKCFAIKEESGIIVIKQSLFVSPCTADKFNVS